MARLYSNENFPLTVAIELRKLGHDVLTVQESGHGNQKMEDAAVLLFATGNSRTLLTLNRRHFVRLHMEQPNHAGIIVCTFDADFMRQAERIDAAIQAAGQLAGQLLRVNRPAR